MSKKLLRILSLLVVVAVALAVVIVSQVDSSNGKNTSVPVAAHYYNWPNNYIPRGIVLSGLESYNITPGRLGAMKNQIHAAKYYWNANTISLQIIQDKMVGVNGDKHNPFYMKALSKIIKYDERLNLMTVINNQTELTVGYAQDESLPTKATYALWTDIMKRWANKKDVVFDLFNEPRRCSWSQWHSSMQPLVNYIRKWGAYNTLWIEGLSWGSTLEGVPLLKGHNLVYVFHHAGAPWGYQAPISPSTWYAAFGYLAAKGIPVVNGEFANYVGSYYWGEPSVRGANAKRLVKKYLEFIRKSHIGFLAWTLSPGVLNARTGYDSLSREPQGAGYLVHKYMTQK